MIGSDMTIAEIVSKYPGTMAVFSKYGFHCFGCMGASFENLRQAAKAHGINLENLRRDLKTVIEGKRKNEPKRK